MLLVVLLRLRKRVGFDLILLGWVGLGLSHKGHPRLPGDIILPDQNGVLYTVTRDEPSSAHTSLGMKLTLFGYQAAQGVETTGVSHLFASQMRAAKYNKTSCLNAFNTSFMPYLSYTMIATQFTEQQWNKMISPAI